MISTDFFADDDEGDKDDKIIHARDTFTAESDVVNRHGELAADRQRRRTFNYLSHSDSDDRVNSVNQGAKQR